MATKLKHQQQDQGGNVLTLTRCVAEGCSKKADRLTFCNEHYDWFKFGLVTKSGDRPTDFDKKYIAYQKRNRKAA